MNFFALSGLINGVTSSVLGIFVFTRNSKDARYITYALFCLATSVWSYFYFGWQITLDKNIALFCSRGLMAGAIFIPVTYLHHLLVFFDIYNQKKKIIFYGYLGGLFFLSLCFTPFFVNDVSPKLIFKFWPNPGIAYHIFIILWICYVVYGFFIIINEYRKSNGFKKNQLRYILLATFIGWGGGATNYPLWYNIPILPVGNILVSGYMLILAYVILRYRLMDITVAITRASIFVAVYTVVMGIPFALGMRLRPWMSGVWGVNWWMAPLGLMAIFATAGPFIYIYLNKKAEEEILKEQRRYQDTLKRASLGMTRVRDINKLLKMIVYTVAKAVRLNHAAIYILNKEADGYLLGSSRGNLSPVQAQTISLNSPLIQYLLDSKSPLLQEELTQNPASPEKEPRPDISSGRGEPQNNLLKAQLYMLSASVVIPSFIEDDLLGFMVLGEKRSGSIYTEDDLRVFTVLASQAGLAIENARFFESAKETHEQIAQAEKMATLGTMADGLSHQMNNRFHAMSLIASDALDCIKSSDSKNSSPEIKELLSYLEHSAQRIKSNSLQGGDIVRGMLKYTRKGETGFAGVNLDELLDATLEMLQFKIKLSEIDIERNYPKDETNLKANFTQLQEVFFNLIDNAYDAMNERKAELKEPGYRGKVKIVAIPDPANRVTKIIVHDNGLGIKEEDQKKIFTPFFTTKISNRKGTGLGLYVIKKIITENHKGRIQVSSIYKQGTTFSLELTTADMAEHAHNAPTKGNIEIWGE